LAQEDEERIKAGEWTASGSITAPSLFMLEALGVEEAM
jgi:hypothetical protein